MEKKIRRIMKCRFCGGILFSFRWEYLEKDELKLYLCHFGYGFQLEDSIVKCETCGRESEYEKEKFIIVEEMIDEVKENARR